MPKLRMIGTADGRLVGDGVRYVAFAGPGARLTVLDTAKGTTRHMALPSACGPYDAAFGVALVGVACSGSDPGQRTQELMDLATGAVRPIPAPSPDLAAQLTFAWSAIGRFWLYGEACSDSIHCSPSYVNRTTGEYRIVEDKSAPVRDLDSATLALPTRALVIRHNDLMLEVGSMTRLLESPARASDLAPIHGDIVTWVDTVSADPQYDRLSRAYVYRFRDHRSFRWSRSDLPHPAPGQRILQATATPHTMVLSVGRQDGPSPQHQKVYAARLTDAR